MVGKASYFIATFSVFARWKTSEVCVSVVDGDEKGRMLRRASSRTAATSGRDEDWPGGEPDDGIFDVLLIGDVTKADLALTLPKIYRGTHLPHPKLELLRGRPWQRRSRRRCRSNSTASSPGRRRS